MPSFSVRDSRGGNRRERDMENEVARLRQQGLTLPRSTSRAASTASAMARQISDGSAAQAVRNTSHINATRARGFGKLASGDMAIALDKQREPLQTMSQKGIPFDTTDPEEMSKIRNWCRSYYATHYLIPLMIDIYSRFPIQGMEIDVKDPQLKDFYEQLFMDELGYEQFLLDFGQEYFTIGEVNALANFNEILGVWDNEELINPEDVIVQRSPFLKNPRYKLKVPELIREVIETQEPRSDYEIIVQQYPEFLRLMRGVDSEEEGLDISSILMQRTVNKASPWDVRGTPHMLRCFSVLISEESLNAAQDAIADRLYSPLILAKLGSPDLGDGAPWIPDGEELENFKSDMQMALAADFRFMAYHFGLEVENVFGREQMPRLGDDYDRIERKLLQVWGIGEALISGGSGQAAYASTALNREFVTQMMTSYQKQIKLHFKKRAEVVAEAQEHFDYKSSNGVRVPEYEEVLMVDEDTGEEYIKKRPKLLVPELTFKTMNLRDEQQERAFMQELKNAGVPVSDQAMMINVPIEFNDEIERIKEEKVQKIVADAEAQQSAVQAIMGQGLPLSPELQLVKQQMDMAKNGYKPVTPANGSQNLNMPGAKPSGNAGVGTNPNSADPDGASQLPGGAEEGGAAAAGGKPGGSGGSGGHGGGGGSGGSGGGGGGGGQAGGAGRSMQIRTPSGDPNLPVNGDPNSPEAQIMQQQQADALTNLQEMPSPPINDIGTTPVNINSKPPGAGQQQGQGRGRQKNNLPRNEIKQRPSVSDEQRPGAPRAANRGSLTDGPSVIGLRNKLSTQDIEDAIRERRWTRSLAESDNPHERLAAAQFALEEPDEGE
jgi:uncharacterized membrane protein YgcG